jgi:hypothetical protein
MKKLFIASLAAAVAFTMVGCKGTNEKRGDEHLKEGRYRNAINSYLEAKKKGSMSDEFYDNFTLALVRAAETEAKKDLNSDLINGYFDKASVNMAEVQNADVVQEYVTTLANNHISSMQNWVSTLGRMLTLDTTKSGSRKGEPNFLTAHFRDLADTSNWDVLVYMYEFCNFKDADQKVECGIYSEMPTAKSRCVGNKLAAAYIGRFVKFLDDLKVKPIKELVAYDMLCKTYPGIKEMIEWCRDNRDKWDNFKEFYAENYKKGQAY